MNNEEFARRIEEIHGKLYKTAFLYLGSEALALDAVDEAVYKGLCGYRKLRQPEFFSTWMTRILINDVVILRYFTGYTLTAPTSMRPNT